MAKNLTEVCAVLKDSLSLFSGCEGIECDRLITKVCDPTAAVNSAKEATLTIKNNTGEDICAVYVWLATHPFWWDNLFYNNRSLAEAHPIKSITLPVGTYHMRAVSCKVYTSSAYNNSSDHSKIEKAIDPRFNIDINQNGYLWKISSEDEDEDGLSTPYEISIGTRWSDKNIKDTDGDNLSDREEFDRVYFSEFRTTTDPTNPDSDGDGFGDGTEMDMNWNPTDSTLPGPTSLRIKNNTDMPICEVYVWKSGRAEGENQLEPYGHCIEPGKSSEFWVPLDPGASSIYNLRVEFKNKVLPPDEKRGYRIDSDKLYTWTIREIR